MERATDVRRREGASPDGWWRGVLGHLAPDGPSPTENQEVSRWEGIEVVYGSSRV